MTIIVMKFRGVVADLINEIDRQPQKDGALKKWRLTGNGWITRLGLLLLLTLLRKLIF